MHQIVVEDLVKTYRVAGRRPGLLGALYGVINRKFRTVRALEGVSFTVKTGELVGYIGPNGAGKSTTIKILSGVLVPDSGYCRVLRHIPWKERTSYVSKIGVVFGQRTQLWWDLPVIDSLDLLRDIYRLQPEQYRKDRDELVEGLNLAHLMDVPVRQLSLGQRMRCDLAASLLHSPEILFLDEPTIGLDAVSKLAVRDFIRKLNRERGVTVILTTHDMHDIEALCSRVMVIARGTILFDGTLDGLRASVSKERRLIMEIPPGIGERDLSLPRRARVVAREGRHIHISFDPREVTPARLISDISGCFEMGDLYVVNPPIDEIISQLYGELGL